MLYEFLNENRTELIARCRDKVALRAAPGESENELEYGVSVFLDQLIKTLQVELSSDAKRSLQISGTNDGQPTGSEMGESASHHGRELLQQGFTVDDVVHDYGDLCQAITTLAFEKDAPIEATEFRTLNRCLDNAVASAVTEFGYHRDTAAAALHSDELNARIGFSHTNCATSSRRPRSH